MEIEVMPNEVAALAGYGTHLRATRDQIPLLIYEPNQ